MSDAAHAHADAHHAPVHIPVEGTFEFTNGKMAMWLFLVSDAMAFIGFLGAYMILRMTATVSPVHGSVPWQPEWMLPMDLILTGVNTFVLICSSVTMVKAMSAIQDGNLAGLKKYLAFTMLGGTFFVGFQVFEWTHFIHEGITIQGAVVPDLDTAMGRVKTAGKDTSRLDMARELFGGRDLTKATESGVTKTEAEFAQGNFTQAEYIALPLILLNKDVDGDDRPAQPGVIHNVAYGIPGTKDHPPVTSMELFQELEKDSEGTARAAVLEKHQKQRAKVANLFSSTFFVLTGFHGLHVFLGVCYLGCVLMRASRGAYTPKNCSPVEIAGLYWHFVDLVWVLLFMLIYLIV